MLFRYRTGRQRHRGPSSPAFFNSPITLGYDGFPSTLITRVGGDLATASFLQEPVGGSRIRLADSRKSIVAPAESIAR
jgi:hypothetical protein